MADRSLEGMALPLEVRARLAELELELSEGNRPGRAAPRCRREAAAGWAGGRARGLRGAGSPRCVSRPPPGPRRVAAGLRCGGAWGAGWSGRPGGPVSLCASARCPRGPGWGRLAPLGLQSPGLALMRNLSLDLRV